MTENPSLPFPMAPVEVDAVAPTEPAPVVARQTYPCAGPCRGSYVFDKAGTFCYRCRRNGHDAPPPDDAPPAPAGPTQDHPRGLDHDDD